MNVISAVLTISGLTLFEIISSIDNAIINAEVLSTMAPKARRWFLLWGIVIAVFFVRGLLPWLIVWGTMPSLGFLGSLTATFSNDPHIHLIIEQSAPVLLTGGGIFLVLLFLHWLFIEPKNYGLYIEPFFYEKGIWFFSIASIVLTFVVWFALKKNNMMAFSAVIGSSAFFITHGFKQSAEANERNLIKTGLSDFNKILYLEIIDTTFSIDGVLGAFAFTFAIPLILIGNGLGAFTVRQITVSNIENIRKYPYLKNGAMYSVFALGLIMLFEGFGFHIPSWLSPVVTFIIIGFFLKKSISAKQDFYENNAAAGSGLKKQEL